MSWLPTFLNAWTAAAAAAVVVPSLLVLYFLKLRRREMAVSSTLLWKKAIQDLQVNAPFQKLRRNLLLFLQLLLLLLLCLAFSRPVTNYTPGAGKSTVILIDRSASMSASDPDLKGKTRLDEAKRRAKELVDTMGRNSSAMVIAFDQSAETVQPFSSDAPLLKRVIDSIQQTDRRSRLKLAYQLAEAQINPEQLRPNEATLPDVWVYSDGRVTDSAELSIRANLHYDKIGSKDTANVGIVAMNAKRNYERATEVQVFARLANYGPAPVNADVQLVVDGKVRSIAGTSLPPERWTDAEREKAEPRESVEFTVDMPDAGIIRVEQMHKEGDALTADDSATVVVPPPKPLQVLLVSDGNSYFLEQALITQGYKNPPMTSAAYEKEKPTKYHVIIFDLYKPKFLPPGGNFIYFGTTPPTGKIQGDPPVYVEQAQGKQKIVGVIDWKRDHPILRDISTFRYIGFADPIKLTVPSDVEILMDGANGPLMSLHREGFSTHLTCAFSTLHSNWPLGHQSFPVFIYNALRYLAIGSDMDVRPSFDPGDTPRIPRANLQSAVGDKKEITLNGPMGSRRLGIPAAGDFALPPLDRVGLYSIDPPIENYEHIAVNLLDPNESNVLPVEQPPGNIGTSVAHASGKSRLELWWWIVVCAALPLLIIEWWVYTRRVHL
jgi:hypothetical protein